MVKAFYVSTDKSLLDITSINNFLSKEAYWAKGRSRTTIEKSIEKSLCFGVFDTRNKQVGFARVVSDFSVFAWLLDVFILESYRGNGLGKMLVGEIMVHKDLKGIRKWGLATRDAHGLYEKFGFKLLDRPEYMMELVL